MPRDTRGKGKEGAYFARYRVSQLDELGEVGGRASLSLCGSIASPGHRTVKD